MSLEVARPEAIAAADPRGVKVRAHERFLVAPRLRRCASWDTSWAFQLLGPETHPLLALRSYSSPGRAGCLPLQVLDQSAA